MDLTYAIVTGLLLLLSIAAFVVVVTWKRQQGQVLMLNFLVFGFILPQLLEMSLSIMAACGMFESIYGGWIYTLISTIVLICRLIGSCLLVGYVAYRSLGEPKPSRRFSQSSSDGSHRYSQSSSQTEFVAASFGPQWNVPPDATLNVKILRQREWGFVFDFVPFIVGGVALISFIASRFGAAGFGGFSSDRFEMQLWGIFWLIVGLQFPYALFRDCISGRSFGKHLSGCRVVDLKTGKPAAAGQSIIRNLPFLIPLFSIVELATASIRADSRRLGDMLAATTVVTGPPDFMDGDPVEAPVADVPEPVKKHPLDD